MTYIYNISRSLGRGLPHVSYNYYDAMALRRLTWLYGVDRANAILDGHDAKSNDDLAAWRSLGQPRSGAAA